jgi:hypothetical protein
MHGMKSVNVIPRWITVNRRIVDFVRERLSTKEWDLALREEIENFFSDQLEIAGEHASAATDEVI